MADRKNASIQELSSRIAAYLSRSNEKRGGFEAVRLLPNVPVFATRMKRTRLQSRPLYCRYCQ
jgi:hypothetical protein